MNQRLIIFRSSADQHSALIDAALALDVRVIDVTNYLEVDRVHMDLSKRAGDRHQATPSPAPDELYFDIKGTSLRSDDRIWHLGQPALTHTLLFDSGDQVFAGVEWAACLVSYLSIIRNDVLWLHEPGPGGCGSPGMWRGAIMLKNLGWSIPDLTWESDRAHVLSSAAGAGELTVVFTRKRWVIDHACSFVFESSEISGLLWKTWESVFRRRCLFATMKIRIVDDVPTGRWIGPHVLEWRTPLSETIVRDAVL